MAGLKKTGNWGEALFILKQASNPRLIKKALDKSLLQEGHFIRKKMVLGMRKQAPGGKRFKPLARTTIATRRARGFRGTKALIRSGDLRNSISTKLVPGGVFIGVLRTAKSKQGRAMVNIAEINERGSRPITIKITPKMRRFLFAAFSKAGIRSPGSGNGSAGTITIKIPARPFIKPVFDKWATPVAFKARFQNRLAINMQGKLGKPNRRPPK